MPDAAVDEHLAAHGAGEGGAIELRPGDAHAVHGGLDDDVLLRVQAAADLVALPGRDAHLLAQAARLQAVAHAGGRAVVTGGQDVPVLDGDGAHLAAQAGGTLTHQIGDVHEVIGPGHSLHDSTRNKKLDYLTRSRGKSQARRRQDHGRKRPPEAAFSQRGAFRGAPATQRRPAGRGRRRARREKGEGRRPVRDSGGLSPVVRRYQVNSG